MFRVASAIADEMRSEIGDRFSRRVLRRKSSNPWMKRREQLLLRELLRNLRPQASLEWGAGFSTLEYPGLLTQGATWMSIDHDEGWAAQIRSRNTNPAVDVIHVPANHYPWTDEHDDGAGSDLADYIEYPTAHAPFDFVLIDGRARNACMLRAVELVSDRGVVVLHDANRVRYHDHFDLFRNQALLLDYRTNAGGLWVGSNGTEISSLIDMDFHRSLWSSVTTLSRFLGPARRYFLGI